MEHKYMKRALTLAQKGIGYTRPNPLVGALIVKDDKVIGEGYHEYYGGPHAEINAFHNATEDVTGSTMYVTLEPCSHYGKTPPCVEAIIKKNIKKVVVAMEDPNPLVAGKGIQHLRNHGIEVVTGILQREAQKLNEIFIKFITTHLPFCTLKTAMTLDGKIATSSGDSKWITNEASRKFVHQIRHQVSAIMVGIGTVLADDPLLTTRLKGVKGKNPIRIIVDSQGRIPLEAQVLQTIDQAQTIVATTALADSEKLKAIEDRGAHLLITPTKNDQVDLSYLMKSLGERKIDSVLLEGGSTLNYSALQEGIIDKVLSFIAPKIIGGNQAKTPVGGIGKASMAEAILLNSMEILRFGNDMMIEAYVRKED
ncbi:bifunctional diaminohydroxyphosphoribosylaminopyrimidine deaminase/5-amino-6-(5-phosphoribosylamino)uracil reductase RibD [Clostridiaceae bacterium 35-E11]